MEEEAEEMEEKEEEEGEEEGVEKASTSEWIKCYSTEGRVRGRGQGSSCCHMPGSYSCSLSALACRYRALA